MSSDIILVLVRSYCRTQRGLQISGSQSWSLGLRGLGGFYPAVSLITFIWCPMSKNSPYYIAKLAALVLRANTKNR